VCAGNATRLIGYVQRMPKRYRGTFLLGRSSASDDTETTVTFHDDAAEPTQVELEAALPGFVGRIAQVPPAYSAVRVAGRRAYELARRGVVPTLESRWIEVYSLAIVHYDFPELVLDIECGSGTYVRSLGRDLARAVGTEAVVSALERTAIGPFCAEEGIVVAGAESADLAQNLQSPLSALDALPRVKLTAEQGHDLRYGRPPRIPLPAAAEYAAVDSDGQLLAILRPKGEHWFPAVNFIAI
jgi:tRNA pseudouridine55 synthase